MLAITTGLRRGELLGLRWDDADLEFGTLRVGRALVREERSSHPGRDQDQEGTATDQPHAPDGERPQGPSQEAARERMKLAGLYKDHDLIFASGVGHPSTPRIWSNAPSSRYSRRLDYRRYASTILRHTCATLLLRGRAFTPNSSRNSWVTPP